MTTNVMFGLNSLEFQPCKYHHKCVHTATDFPYQLSLSSKNITFDSQTVRDFKLHLTAFAQYFPLSLRSSKLMKGSEAGRTVKNRITTLSLITCKHSHRNYKAQIIPCTPFFVSPFCFPFFLLRKGTSLSSCNLLNEI